MKFPTNRSVPKEQAAQELAWAAMEHMGSDPDEATRLCHAALGVDPRCVDALTMLAEIECRTAGEFVERLQVAVAHGRAAVGPKRFKELRGFFWLDHETRPFMRAMAMLADALVESETKPHLDEAIAIYEEMLELNPNDNQGVRDLLVACYLRNRRHEAAERLLDRHRDDGFAIPLWARVLVAHVRGDVDAAARRLADARAVNPHVEGFLSGRRRLPRRLPERYELGSVEEAIICADRLAKAWAAFPKSRAWLKAQSS